MCMRGPCMVGPLRASAMAAIVNTACTPPPLVFTTARTSDKWAALPPPAAMQAEANHTTCPNSPHGHAAYRSALASSSRRPDCSLAWRDAHASTSSTPPPAHTQALAMLIYHWCACVVQTCVHLALVLRAPGTRAATLVTAAHTYLLGLPHRPPPIHEVVRTHTYARAYAVCAALHTRTLRAYCGSWGGHVIAMTALALL